MGQYLTMFYFQAIPLFFYTILALFIQSLCSNKYVGMFITALFIFVFGTPLLSQLGLIHPLFQVGFFPRTHYTNMTGYSSSIKQFHHLAMYWTALGLILALLSFKLWQRGTAYQFSFKIKQLFLNWKKWQRLSLVVFTVLFISSGSVIYYNTNVVNEYKTAKEKLDYRESYERKFKQYATLGKLYPVAIKTEVDLFPKERRYLVKADYVLKNKGNNPVYKLLITERIPMRSIHIENAVLIKHDSIFGTYLFQFKKAIQPQQEVVFKYSLEKKYTGYQKNRIILPNGSYVTHRDFDPFLSYTSSIEINNTTEREKRNLPKTEVEQVTDGHLKMQHASHGKVTYESIVSTQKNETAISSGDLLKKWTKNDRNYYHFKTQEKIILKIAYFSANYTTKTENYKGIQVEQYYNAEHQF